MAKRLHHPWIFLLCAVLAGLAPFRQSDAALAANPTWYSASWHYRVPVVIPANAGPGNWIVVPVNFNTLLSQMGITGTLDNNSIRVVRSDGRTLVSNQEFDPQLYNGAPNTQGPGTGDVNFIDQDSSGATDWIYFDITANGAKPANPQIPIDGDFESGSPGEQSPPGWTGTSSNTAFDDQVRPSENPTITSDGTMSVSGQNPKTVDGTPYSGSYSYLLGARTNNEPNNSTPSNGPSVTLSRTIVVSSVNPGSLTFHWRPEGWDSCSNNQTSYYDYMDAAITSSNGTVTYMVGPQAGNYATNPFCPNYGTNQAGGRNSGYGQFNGFDMTTKKKHQQGMSVAYGAEPWFTYTKSLAAYAGQTITLTFSYFDTNLYHSWVSIDDVTWSQVTASAGTPQSYGAVVSSPPSQQVFYPGQTLKISASVDALAKTVTADILDPNGNVIASGVQLYDDGTHGSTSGGSVWTNDGSDPAHPTHTFSTTDLPGAWTIRVYAYDQSGTTGTNPAGLPHIPGKPLSPVTSANYYSVAEQTINLAQTYMVSGVVYNDANHDSALDGGEGSTGQALYVKLVQNSTLVSQTPVNTSTGAYSLMIPSSGSYELVLSTSSGSSVTPSLPAGWLATQNSPGAVNLQINTVTTSGLPPVNFGLFHGSTLTGTIFRDDGTGGGTPNNGTQDGTEPGLSGVQVVLSQSGSTLDSETTDGSGSFTAWIPASASGNSVSLSEPQMNGYLLTGGSLGNLPSPSTSSTPPSVTFTPSSGSVYSGVSVGEVPSNALAPNGAQTGQPGTTVYYAHTYKAYTAGSVSLSVTSSPYPSSISWSPVLYRDPNCLGKPDASDIPITGPIPLSTGATLCVLVNEFIPAQASAGSLDRDTLTATYAYANAPSLSSSNFVVDTTTASAQGSGSNLGLTKTVSNLTTGTRFSTSDNATPGQQLQYKLSFINNSASSVSNIVVSDTTPSSTTFDSASCDAVPSTLTCTVTQAPSAGGQGLIQWTLSGTLAPAATGDVLFTVTVD